MRKFKLFFACLLMAVFSIGQVWATVTGTYNLITNVSDLAANDVVILVNNANNKALQGLSSTSTVYGTLADVTATNGVITLSSANVEELTVEVGYNDSGFSFKGTSNISGYLNWTSGNSLTANATKSASTSWSVSVDANGVATISNNGTTNRRIRYNSSSPRFATYAPGNNGYTGTDVRLYKKTASQKPTVSVNPDGGNFVGSVQVTLTPSEDATAYYTTDASKKDNPSTSTWTEYNSSNKPSFSNTTTLYVSAVKNSVWSESVVTKTFTKVEPYTSIADLFEDKTNSDQQVYVTFGDWKVSAIKGGQAYVTDGTNGLIIYQSGHGFAIGNTLSGTVPCTLVAFNGAAELKNVTNTTTGLTVTPGTIDPVVKTVAEANELTSLNIGSLIKLEGVTYNGSALVDEYSNTITPSNNLFSGLSLENGKKYDVTGVFQIYNSVNQIYPRSATDVVEVIEEGAPEAPTFSVAAGEYTSVQSVELSCATNGATIYYTTDGSTPSAGSTEYTAAISVSENMTIKAIAIKNAKVSSVATAAYVINLPPDPETTHTWDLSIDETATAGDNELTWTSTYVNMSFAKGSSSTKSNNYYPGTSGKSYTSTRTYSGSVITITPIGKQITTIVFNATSNDYATALANSTWTNATAVANAKVVTVTALSTGAVSAAVGGTCGFTSVTVNYGPIDASIPEAPTFSVAAGSYTSVQTVELSCVTEGAKIYYTTDGSTPDNTKTEYTDAITVNETMTIKAIAIKDSKSGPVATASYIINLPIVYTTIQAIYDKAVEVGSTETEVNIAFNNWVVSGVSGANVYVTDGTNGFVIYGSEHGFAVNDKLNGTVTCTLKLYKYFAEVVGLKKSDIIDAGGSVTDDGVVTPVASTIADLGAVNNGAPVILNSVLFNGTVLSDGANSITPYTTFYADAVTSLESGKYYNITGIYIYYNNMKEIAPRSAADIVEKNLQPSGISYSPAEETIEVGDSWSAPTFNNEHNLTVTFSGNNDAVATVNTTTGEIALAGGTGTAVITASFAGDATYAATNVTYTITVNPASVTENVVILAVYETKYYAMSTTIPSEAFTAIEVEYDGSQVTVNSAEDKAAIQWTKKTSGDNTTFQTKGETSMYMKGTSGGAAMSLNANVCNWSWDGTNEYYYIGSRSFFYQNGVGFKNYATSNIKKTGYSDKAQVIAIAAENIVITSKVSAELAYDPESDEITEGDAWSAPALVNPHTVTITSYATDNDAVATVTDGGVIALAGGIGTAHITAHFDGDASYLEGDAVYTITVNAVPEPADVCDGTDDFLDTEDKGNPTSYKDRSTPNGWSAVNAGYKVIDEKAYWMINGKTTAVGVITSPELTGGLGSLKFRYANTNSESNGVSVKIEIKQSGDVVKEYTLTKPNSEVEQNTVYTELIEDINVAGTFQIVITNLSPSNNTGNKDRVSIGRFCWTGYTAPEPPVEDWTEGVRTGLHEGWYYTMCLEKAVTDVRGASIWSVVSKTDNGEHPGIILEEAELPLVAGRPYIFNATAANLDVIYTGAAVGAPVTEGNNGLVGSFTGGSITQSPNNYIIHNNELYYVNSENVTVGAHRAYLDMTAVPNYNGAASAPGRRRVVMTVHSEQTTTDIDALNASEAPVKMIIDGQLFILRGEKMFNANGQLVK